MQPAHRQRGHSSREERLQHSIALLEEVLKYLDELGDYQEIGARLSGVIDELKDAPLP